LLSNVGERLQVTYDCGDLFEHGIELEEISDKKHETKRIGAIVPAELVQAIGACPPENSEGLSGMGNMAYIRWLQQYDMAPTPAKKRELTKKIQSNNTLTTQFDPDIVNVDHLRQTLVVTCLSPPLPGAGLTSFTMNPFGPASPSVGSGNIARYPAPSSTTMIRTCLGCGELQPAFRCAGCRLAFYCSHECRANHWKYQHKVDCKNWAKEGVIDDSPTTDERFKKELPAHLPPESLSCCGFCSSVGTKEKPLLKCKACRMVYYCDVNCAKKNWLVHKEACARFIKSGSGG
jgi:hypothetical protein